MNTAGTGKPRVRFELRRADLDRPSVRSNNNKPRAYDKQIE